MASVTIINEKPMSMAEVKDELGKILKKKGELNYRANKTHDYLQEFTRLSGSKSKDLMEALIALKVPRLKDEHLVKIIDTLPKFPDEVKVLLSGYTITISQENTKKIAEKVKSFC